MTQDKAPEWAEKMAAEVGEAIYGRHERGWIMWPLISEDGQLPSTTIALALSQAYERGQESMRERAAEKAEGISLNPPETWVVRVGEDYAYTLSAQECARSIRSLPIEQDSYNTRKPNDQ